MIAKRNPFPEVVYPDSDGKPMADNTRQFEWIVTIKGNLEDLFRDNPRVFVAGDNLIYPVLGDPKIRSAPDVYIAFERPKGHRGSYKLWEEDNIFPQVVFEVLSPGNTRRELDRKFDFYQTYGAEEYFIYDPDRIRLSGYRRVGRKLVPIEPMHGHVSARLGIRFDMSGEELVIWTPDGKPFLTFLEWTGKASRAERERDRERERADAEAKRAETLRAKLRALGMDPDAE